MFFSKAIYYMPKQTQVDYWENEWDIRDLEKQIASAEKKAWWPTLKELLDTEVGDDDLIVEAGCGMGQFVYMLDKMGKRVLGVDVTERAVQRTLENYPDLDLQVQDIRDFKLDDDSVKLMISLGVVEHFIEGPQDPLREAARVIKPGGILFITIPYTNRFRRKRELWWRIKYFFATKKWFQKLTGSPVLEFYQYTYSEDDVKKFLGEHGFEVEQVLLHHSHVTAQKDFKNAGWFRREIDKQRERELKAMMAKKPEKEQHKVRAKWEEKMKAEEEKYGGEIPNKRLKQWASEQEAEDPDRFAHIALYVARRVS